LGFTAQGEVLVARAQSILSEAKALEQEMRAADGPVSGTLTLGVVPTALAQAADLIGHLHKTFPSIEARIESASSINIQQGLEQGSLDAGLTYQDGVSLDLMHVDPVYEENYVLLAPRDMINGTPTSITWSQAAELPLTLLDPQMQNRRILDTVFADLDLRPKVISQANVFNPALTLAQNGVAATIIPSALVSTVGALRNVHVLPLIEPTVSKAIGLIYSRKGPILPVVQALRQVISEISS